jgi:RNA:NAD 2'-phosphotransferase (TPT1/KptA family)
LPEDEVRTRFGKRLTRERLRTLKTISKELAYLLRHGANRYRLIVRLDVLVAIAPLQRVLAERHGLFVDEIGFYELDAHAEKRRFELKEGTPYGSQTPRLAHIRAISGHSMSDVQDDQLLGPPVPESALGLRQER